jgi:hypothetical protein
MTLLLPSECPTESIAYRSTTSLRCPRLLLTAIDTLNRAAICRRTRLGHSDHKGVIAYSLDNGALSGDIPYGQGLSTRFDLEPGTRPVNL